MAHAVRFDGVTKRYPRGWTEGEEPRYASLRHDLASVGKRLSSRARGRPARETGALALKDVSFEIEEGESFAIIGPNGAGKSTALKLISRISYPTSGRIGIRGRVAALMEVGSGVHPELTGRENIWLYGQILGMTKADIRRRFDAIVEFSELGGAIDTPVKFFSSGMQLRLGFSIAAHLEPSIFLVDEALAVGDSGFAAKCMRRMRELVQQGRTLLLVSHNMPAIEAVCSRGVLMSKGRVVFEGSSRELVGRYFEECAPGTATNEDDGIRHPVFGRIALTDLVLSSSRSEEVVAGEPLEVAITISCERDLDVSEAILVVVVDGSRWFLRCNSIDALGDGFVLPAGETQFRWNLDYLPVSPGSYPIDVEIGLRHQTGVVEWLEQNLGMLVVATPPADRPLIASVLRAESAAFAPFKMSIEPKIPTDQRDLGIAP